MATTVAGAEPESAAKNAQASTSVSAMPPRTPPMMERANSQMRREIPPLVIRLPERTKNAMAMMEVESRPPKIRWATVLMETVMSGLPAMAAIVDTPSDSAMGTPRIRSSAKPPNISNAVMLLPPLSSRLQAC